MADIAMIEAKYHALSGRLDEAALRIWAATEARSLGRGGVSMVAKAIGMSRTTIYAGLSELKLPASPAQNTRDGRLRVRAVGGGRKRLADKDANLLSALDALVEP
ncbi:MAG: ISAzo13 family transposase, partial [Ferrimicrobium sp.]